MGTLTYDDVRLRPAKPAVSNYCCIHIRRDDFSWDTIVRTHDPDFARVPLKANTI